MKNCRLILAAAAVLLAASCSDKAKISGTVTGAPDSKITVNRLAGSAMEVLDTVKTDGEGRYSYNVDVEKGQPQFVYVYRNGVKLASLLLSQGDKVEIVSDTLGSCTVTGSEESVKLQQVEKDFSDFLAKFSASVDASDQALASRLYVDYYRSRLKYVLDNSKSLTAIPVLYQKINDDFPVFSQATDAIIFKSIHDSLMTVYPESMYVTALGDEAERRDNLLGISMKMQGAEESFFPDLELPSTDGKKVRLSDVDSKVTMVYFWTASDAEQKLFNNDFMIPLYNDYHSKGFEIYSVSLDTDKAVWASAVKNQKLPWINVCDGHGAASPAAAVYNVGSVPMGFLIIDGVLAPNTIRSNDDLRRVLATNLR